MQSKILLVIGAILAPLVAAAPAVSTEAQAADHVVKDRSMDPLFEVMAWKEGLDEILKNAMKNKAEDHGSKNNNNGWSHPIWPYE
ncbi:hypothetical protein F4860DRAFT_493510 [Xylaria cubensis]|nr:hypothetical protein F4860DRAFT_493510 [Xylaria cubensis]